MAHRDKIEWMIETSGWAFQPVPARPDPEHPLGSYGYTIGLPVAFGFPEIVVFGLTAATARGLVGLVVDLLGDEVDIPIGTEFTGLLDGEQRSVLLPVDLTEHAELFDSLLDWHGGPVELVQLLWPDRNGFLPTEAGFAAHLRMAQPVIGRRTDPAG
jgi:hypothetical protein